MAANATHTTTAVQLRLAANAKLAVYADRQRTDRQDRAASHKRPRAVAHSRGQAKDAGR